MHRSPFLALATLCSALLSHHLAAQDLDAVVASGQLRHLGIPYAHFVTGPDSGMDVELMAAFAQDLGIQYTYVKTDWGGLFGDLIGQRVKPHGDTVERLEAMPIRGDVAANGITVLPWRSEVVDFSAPTFPNQVWLVATAESSYVPITPSQNIDQDIAAVRELIRGRSLLGKAGTCLDPSLYRLSDLTDRILLFPGSLNDLAPALIKGDAELTLLDVPDALVALQKWPGKIKILGPVSRRQDMAVAFPKNAPALRERFNAFLARSRANGTFDALVKKYYPFAFQYYPDFFTQR